jgi:DNA-binding response OmpR family regulator
LKSGKPILIVDDDPYILDFLEAVLQASGYLVVTAGGGHEALQWLESNRPGLILLDMSMPVMNGTEFLQKVRSRSDPGPPVVVMTAMDDARRLSRDLGTKGWLQKPFDLDTLLMVVESLLE